MTPRQKPDRYLAPIVVLTSFLVCLVLLIACDSQQASTNLDVQATIDASVQATIAAQPGNSNTTNSSPSPASVHTPTPSLGATPIPTPSPTPIPLAPDFTLELFKGSVTSSDNSTGGNNTKIYGRPFPYDQFVLSDHRGKIIIINFWASWAPPSTVFLPVLEEIWRTYGEQDVVVVGPIISDTEESVTRALKMLEISFPVGFDPDGAISIDYGAIGIPTTFIVNQQGILVHRLIGGVSKERMVEIVEEVLSTGTVSSSQTP